MHDEHGRNSLKSSIGGFTLELPRILPVFERTEPRTTHHWREALQNRRMARKGRRQQLIQMARIGANMLGKLVDEHHSNRFQP